MTGSGPVLQGRKLELHPPDQAFGRVTPCCPWYLPPQSLYEVPHTIPSTLDRVLGPAGFDAKRDIAGITISRWAHGCASGMNELHDPDWSHRADAPWVVGRQRFGRIAISNSDAAATSLTQAAFAQSHRAVSELINDIVRPVYEFSFSERDSSGPLGAWPNTL